MGVIGISIRYWHPSLPAFLCADWGQNIDVTSGQEFEADCDAAMRLVAATISEGLTDIRIPKLLKHCIENCNPTNAVQSVFAKKTNVTSVHRGTGIFVSAWKWNSGEKCNIFGKKKVVWGLCDDKKHVQLHLSSALSLQPCYPLREPNQEQKRRFRCWKTQETSCDRITEYALRPPGLKGLKEFLC